MLLKVTTVHLEAANLKQICNESMNDPETVKEKIIDLVETRENFIIHTQTQGD